MLGWYEPDNAPRRWLDDLSPAQRTFWDDPAKIKAAVCGRRAGKTWLAAVGLYEAARRTARTQCPYIALSAVSARRIMLPVLEDINARYRLGMQIHRHELTARLDNGSEVFMVGGDDMRKVEALRGGRYARVVVDESASFPAGLMRYLCEDVLAFALMDLDGDLWLMGSPNAAAAGHFHDLTTGDNPEVQRVSSHHWTVLDNPHIPHAAAWLERFRREKGWDELAPGYQREGLGRWVRDATMLVFRFDGARHLETEAPTGMRRVLGVDLGASKEKPTTAFVVCGWTRWDQVTHVEHAEKIAGVVPSTGADIIARLMREWPGISHVIVDAGGLGWGYVEEWRRRGLPVVAAEKRDKRAYIEFLNSDLDAGRLRVAERGCGPLLDEMRLLQWDEAREQYDDRFADHACCAAGTLIQTDHGPTPIESIRPGMLVYTRRGLRTVLAAGRTGIRPLMRVTTGAGRAVLATADHQIFTNRGKTPLRLLMPGDTLSAWESTAEVSKFGSLAKPSGAIQSRPTGNCVCTSGGKGAAVYIKRSGNMNMGSECRVGIMSTIPTRIPPTTIPATLRSSRAVGTCRCMRVRPSVAGHLEPTSGGLLSRLASGTDRSRGSLGIASMEKEPGLTASLIRVHALSAPRCSPPNSIRPRCAAGHAELSSAEIRDSTTKSAPVSGAGGRFVPTGIPSRPCARDHVLRVEQTRLVEPVYNLTVDGEHEYFANGILVVNCDALLYAWRECYAWAEATRPPMQHVPGSPEWVAAEALKAKQRAIAEANHRDRAETVRVWRQMRSRYGVR